MNELCYATASNIHYGQVSAVCNICGNESISKIVKNPDAYVEYLSDAMLYCDSCQDASPHKETFLDGVLVVDEGTPEPL